MSYLNRRLERTKVALFSSRYNLALKQGHISVEIPDGVRRKIWARLDTANRYSGLMGPSMLQRAWKELETEQGWNLPPAFEGEKGPKWCQSYSDLILGESPGYFVFDLIELACEFAVPTERKSLPLKINEILSVEEIPWCLVDGEFIRVDQDFIGSALSDTARQALLGSKFRGAADEFAEARQEQAAGKPKKAILDACKSYESALKVMTSGGNVSADGLLKAFLADGYLDDLPEDVRQGFSDVVLKSLAVMRNKLAGHGQGEGIVTVPAIYGELAIQIASALLNFLIAKDLQRTASKK